MTRAQSDTLCITRSNEHPRKRAKINESLTQSTQSINMTTIARNVKHILDDHDLVLISSETVQRLKNGSLQDTKDFYPSDINISCHQFVQNIHSSFVGFFSLPKSSGFIFGTIDGSVNWRDFESKQDILLFKLEEDEKVLFLDLIQTSEIVEMLIAIGDQGTIISYAKSDKGLEMRQFNIQSPVYSIDKVQDLKYVVSTGIGKVSVFDLNHQKGELESTRLLNISNVQHLRVLDNENHIFETISEKDGCIEFSRIKYNTIPISIENNAEAMQQLIEETLQELAQEEAMVKSMEIKEQVLQHELV